MKHLLTMLALLGLAATAAAQPTAFTYQGRLKHGAALAAGLHDFRFTLFDAASGGAQIGSAQCVDNLVVTDGLFTTTLDFGQQFATTEARFLQIEVRADTGLTCANSAGLAPLGPRQPLTAAPMASHAKSAFALDAGDGSPASAVFVDNAGNVGVGTMSPLANFDVRTTGQGVRIQGAFPGVNNGAYLAFANGAGTDLGYIGDGSSGDNSMYLTSYANDIFLYTAAGAALTAKSTGHVGIGTTTPTARLTVAGDALIGGPLTATSINISSTTRSWTMHPYGLTDTIPGSGGQYTLNDTGLTVVGVGNEFAGSVHLPDGATIIALEVLGHDGSTALGADVIATLGRTDFAGGTLEMASVSSQLGGSVWQTTNVVFPTVDNDTHSYWVRVTLHGGVAPPFDVTLRAIRIIYRISQPLP